MQEKRRPDDKQCLYIMLFVSVCDCVIVIGGWTIYKWDGAGITIAAGVLGVITSLALCCWLMIEDDRKQKQLQSPQQPV
jgi:hypothetical protein